MTLPATLENWIPREYREDPVSRRWFLVGTITLVTAATFGIAGTCYAALRVVTCDNPAELKRSPLLTANIPLVIALSIFAKICDHMASSAAHRIERIKTD